MKKSIFIFTLLFAIIFFTSYIIFMGRSVSNLYPFSMDGKYGFINEKGKIVIEPKFNLVQGFSEGLAPVAVDSESNLVKKTEKHLSRYILGFIDKNGTFVIEPQFEIAHTFSDGLAMVWAPNQQSGGCIPLMMKYIDKTGKTILEPKICGQYGSFSEGLAKFKERGKEWGYMDKKGNVVIPPQFDLLPSNFSEGLACASSYGKYGYIDKTGTFILQPKFDSCHRFSEGLAGVKLNKEWGFINKKGEFVIQPQFFDAGIFQDGLAAVQQAEKGKWGFISRQGKIVITPKYEQIAEFLGGIARVRINGKDILINKSEKIVWEGPTESR